jgi:LPS export ABC transporter protein LptC
MGPFSQLTLTRRRARFWLGMILVATVAGVGVQLARSQWVQHLRRLKTGQIEFLPEAAQRIQNFRRVKMEGGRKAWEVAAREAQYFEDDHEIVVQEPEVSFYLKDGEGTVSVTGTTGRIVLEGREMDRVELEGGIQVRFKDYLVRTDRAVYERSTDTVVSPAVVSITGDGVALTGSGMTVEMGSQRVRLQGDVETVLTRVAEGANADAL